MQLEIPLLDVPAQLVREDVSGQFPKVQQATQILRRILVYPFAEGAVGNTQLLAGVQDGEVSARDGVEGICFGFAELPLGGTDAETRLFAAHGQINGAPDRPAPIGRGPRP